jgi:hypothetical protein
MTPDPDSIEAGDEMDGIFIYQSMSGGRAVSFEGELMFVPGSLREPQAAAFPVRVAQFPLTCSADDYIF